jgi:prepilin-type N-terminal cleavage/methylation domain-containing protein
MKSTSGFTLIELFIVIAVLLVVCALGFLGQAYTRGASDSKADTPQVKPPRFIETKVLEGGFGNNPVFLITDTKTGQEWLRAFQYGFAQVSPSATAPGVLRCEAEVTR